MVEEADRWARVLVHAWWWLSLLLWSLWVVEVADRWALVTVVEVADKWEPVWVQASLLSSMWCLQSQMVPPAWGNHSHIHAHRRDGEPDDPPRDAGPAVPATDGTRQLRPKPICKWPVQGLRMRSAGKGKGILVKHRSQCGTD